MNNAHDIEVLAFIKDLLDDLNTVPSVAAVLFKGKPFRQYYKDTYGI